MERESTVTNDVEPRSPLRRFHRDQRGVIHVEYLIVTICLSLTAALAIRGIGPKLLDYHRGVVTVVLEEAP